MSARGTNCMTARPERKPKVTILPDIVKERRGWAPYKKLALRGVPLGALERFMIHVLFRHAASARRDWDRPRAIKPHTLRRLPERIRKFAKQIELVNSDPILDPMRALVPERDQRQGGRNLVQEIRDGIFDRAKLASDFKDLSTVLRHYAEFLDLITDVVGQQRRHPYNPLHHCLVAFVQLVKQFTGKFMYADVTELANAVIVVAGGEGDIDPASLATLYRNNPHLRCGIPFD